MDKKYSILYVDDEESNLHIFKDTFRREYNIYTAISAKEGLEILDKEEIDLILTDQRMPEMDGVEFLKSALNKYPDLNRILVTAYTDFDAIRNAINDAKIFQYIQKPWTEEKLRDVIEQSLEVYRLKRENETLTEELKIKNEQLEQINRELIKFEELKSDFLSIISHEIRTPLNGLVGPLELLKGEVNVQSEYIESLMHVLENSVKKLEQFSISALNMTLLKAKKYRLNVQNINIRETIEESVKLLKDNINSKDIIIKYDIAIDSLTADKDLFKICIKELIDNAIKYSSKEDTIDIKTFKDENWFVFEVIDYGKGFDKKYLDQHRYDFFLFSDEVKNKSIGLKLALIKLIMDAHSGKIEVGNNKNGKGANVKLFFKNDVSD